MTRKRLITIISLATALVALVLLLICVKCCSGGASSDSASIPGNEIGIVTSSNVEG